MLTPIDYYYLISELKKIVGYRIKNIFLSKDIILELKSKDRKFFVVGKNYCYLTDKELKKERESNFAEFLLRKLKNRKVTNIYQNDFNKILILEFGKLSLIFEFIGKGNIILCEDDKIVSASTEREFKCRKILRGEKYVPPIGEKVSWDIKEKNKLLKLHVGEIYAEEIVKRDLRLRDLLKEKVSPRIYFKGKEKYIVAPFELKTLNLEFKKKNTFSEAVEEFYREMTKKERIKKEQNETLKKYKKQEKSFAEEAEKLLRYKKEIEEVVEGWKKNKEFRKPITKISGNKIFLELEGVRITIRLDEDLKKKIDDLYRKSKKARNKIKRIKDLMERCDLQTRKRKSARGEKREWYTKFRYFFTSDGFLVVAGKDAETNEQIVKKHCKKNDIVLHAHIPGSPFGVIKSEGKEIPKNSIEEAAQFVGCYSKFWTSKMGIADVYWVLPEQVSKKVAGHQSIKKGSFMIYGKRNFLRVELKLCIGLDENGCIVKGPERAVKKYAKNYIVIVPGNNEGKQLGSKIKSLLKEKSGKKDRERIESINADEFLKVIPYGKGEIL